MNSFLGELRRRNVFRVGVAYAVAAWLLLQVADIVLEAIEAPPWAMKALLLLLVLGWPLALVFAWVFELTPQGLKRESEIDRSDSITHQTGQRLNYLIIGVLVLAVGFLLFDKLVLSKREPAAAATTSEPLEKSIAVLPFVNMSPDPDNEYFSDGLSEELLNLLAKVDGLKVAARTSSFKFKGSGADISEIGAALGVATVLEGSVRKTGQQARITAQLINVTDGFHLWSETYDRSLDDIFAVQDEIAGAIVEALKLPLMGTDDSSVTARATRSYEAYDLYLLGRHRARQFSAESFREAIAYFQRAIEADPDYAPAYSGLADAYLGLTNYGDLSMAEAVQKAEQAVDRALQLDPSLAEAWASEGQLLMDQRRVPQALAAFEKAVKLNPNLVYALIEQAAALGRLGRNREAVVVADRAFELDPMSDYVRQQRLIMLAQAGRGEEVRELALEWAGAEPENPFPFETLGDLYLSNLGQPQRAVVPYARAHELRPGDTYMARGIATAFLTLGDLPSAKRWLEEARRRGPRTLWTQLAAYDLALAEGDVDMQRSLIEQHLLENPDSTLALSGLGVVQLRDGQLDAAEDTLKDALRRMGDAPELPLSAMTLGPAVNLAVIHEQRGNRGELEMLLQRLRALRDVVLDNNPRSEEGSYLAARIASLEGDRERTLDGLRAAIRNGFREDWRIVVEPAFARWRDDRLFQALVSELRRQNAGLRAELMQSEDGRALAAAPQT
ncbi:MAG TPA: tetratricopeptide repeat protein [Steroidobacteraceae bacterium]|nr:tetratricopeptide repeat protein [Steroidobacteraceae bacterium]